MAVGLACLIGISYHLGTAQGGPAAALPEVPHKVGLIDMSYVFREYKNFAALRETLKGEFEQNEQKAKAMAEQIQAIQGEMKSGVFKQGSEEFLEREKKLAQLTTEFEAFRKITQRDFMRRESQIYNTIYQEVSAAVEKFSRYYQYTLVMRFNRDELSSNDPQKLLQGLNRQVVYFSPHDDITESVLAYLNERFDKAHAAGAATSPAAGRRPAARQPATPGTK